MGFRTGAYATIWSIEPGRGNYTKVRLSVSKKNRETGQYEQDFSGYVMLVGQAHARAQSLRERDRIKLGDIDVSTNYDKVRQREYVNYKCFSFEMADEAQNGDTRRTPDDPDIDHEEDADGRLPF